MGWESYEKQAESGPWGLFKIGLLAIVMLAALGAFAGIIGRGCSVAGEVATVAQKELGATALLKKYEWFKNASAQLDKKRADIKVYENQIARGAGRATDRFTQDRLFQWETELMGVRSSYNSLAAEYNAQMAKINWRFTNIGDLPSGASEPLPRSFKPYTEE